MTDDGTSRFTVRKGAIQNTWMVWDRKTRSPAKVQGGLATRLTQERAQQVWEQLTGYYGSQPKPA